MKNQNVLRILALVFAIAMMLTIASCDVLSNLLGKPEETTPEVTTEEPTEVTTPEATEPPHVHNFVEGTCECGETDPNYVPPHVHNFVEGTCECGETDPNYVPPHVHAWDNGVETTPATCTAEGVKTYTCECGETKTEAIPVIAHTYGDDGKCTCGAVDPDYVAPHVHEWDAGVVTKEPTCTEEGVKTFTCACKETKTEAIAKLDHVYGNQITAVVPATCTEVGKGTYKCLTCDETKEVTITPRHNIVDGKCTIENCGFEVKSVDSISDYDYDADKAKDVFTFYNALPMAFVGEDVYHIDAVNDMLPSSVRGTNHTWYDEVVNGTSNADGIPMPYAHVYTDDTAKDLKTQYLDYQIYVDKAGVYDLAIHFRLKRSDNHRGARFIINRGTADEYNFYTTFNINKSNATLVTDTEKNLSTYMAGIQVSLKEGMNTIRITLAIKDDGTAEFTKKAQHFRNLYFVYNECATNGHTYGDPVVVDPTCTAAGSKTYTCSVCGDVKVEETPIQHKWNEAHTECTACGVKILTAEEAYNLGITYAEGSFSTEKYFVKLTVNYGANDATSTNPGFGREELVKDSKYLSITGKYTLPEGETWPAKGDTIIVYGTIGAVNSNLDKTSGNTREARVTVDYLVLNITPEAAPAQ